MSTHHSRLLVGIISIFLAMFHTAVAAEDGEATEIVGGKGGGVLSEVPNPHQSLVGFDVTYSNLGPARVIRSLQAIYDKEGKQVSGKTFGSTSPEHIRVEAKPGYAVGAIYVRGGDRIDGLRAVFMRTKDGKLDPTDAYESRWLGGRGGKAETKLGGDGRRAIGIKGRFGAELDAIGLVLEK